MTKSMNRTKRTPSPSSLMVRLDQESKTCLVQAAELRGVSVSDFVRTVTVAQARKEIEAASQQTIALTPGEQLAFWKALQQPARLTAAQQRLGAMMRGKA